MNRFRLMTAALLLVSAVAAGQSQASETAYDFRSRTSVGIDWEMVKGFSLDARYELRTADMFSRIDRHELDLGLEYSPVKYFKLGAGYSFIGAYNSDREFRPRNRIYLDLTGSYKFGGWKLSLREKLQMTNRPYDINEYQQTRNLVELKSKLKLSYRGFAHLEPYTYVELRNCFNGPSFTADYDESSGKYSNYSFTGYSDVYINRVRATLGVDWKISHSHSIDFSLYTDWCHDKVIDTNAKGTKLKAYYWEEAVINSLVIGYTFSF